MAPERIKHGTQLLVEGNDARNFFEALVAHMALAGVQVQNFGGVTQLRRFLSAFVNIPRFQEVGSIGIVRDAELRDAERAAAEPRQDGTQDDQATRAFQSVQDSLRHVALPVPERPCQPTGERRSVNVLILPGDNRPGMLETLLCETFSGAPMEQCVDALLQCAEASGQAVQRRDKARAHAWLATRPGPVRVRGCGREEGLLGTRPRRTARRPRIPDRTVTVSAAPCETTGLSCDLPAPAVPCRLAAPGRAC